ncbi:MAG: hypothetical protein WDN25_08190 [Acetobacteraceae bacterium]
MRRVLPAAAVATVVLVAGLLYGFAEPGRYLGLAEAWGAAPFRTPFLDMHGVTSVVQCYRLGFDVFVQNPCDVFGRTHGYSPLWLRLSVLPLSAAWDVPLGIASIVVFLASLLLLPPGRGWPQVLLITLASLSSATMFALERANVDLLVFVMAVLVVRLRWLGPPIALLAGMLKFYPIVLLAVVLRERLAVCLAIGLAALAVIAVWFAFDGRDIMRAVASVPTMRPFDDNAFGARTLAVDLAPLLGWSARDAPLVQIAMIATMLAVAAWRAKPLRLHALSDNEAGFLLAGCVLLVGCFVLAQNVSYRGIFLLFVLPALAVLRWHGTLGLSMLLMWNGALHRLVELAATAWGIDTRPDGPLLFGYWLVHEAAWWVLITLLTTLLLRLIWESRAWRGLTWTGPM